MKKLSFIILALACLSLYSCYDDSDELTGDENVGGLVQLANPNIGYIVGNDGTYTARGEVYQGRVQTTSIDVYKSFTDSETGETSETVLLTTIPIEETEVGTTAEFSTTFTYEELIAGLSVNGEPVPENDTELNIGDFFTLSYDAELSNGEEHLNAATTKVAVATRFAGEYEAIAGAYYRLGVQLGATGDWPPVTVIESVDATTYRVVEYAGIFNANTWYFQINEDDEIIYPALTPDGDPQVINGQPLATCATDPGAFTNVPCGANTNIVIRNDETGADQLVMTFGYVTPGSGPREFYQVLQKIVE